MNEEQSKPKAPAPKSKASVPPTNPWGAINWLLLVMGLLLLVVGFIVLSLADARAENWAGVTSPLMILAGFVLVFFSILVQSEKIS